MKFRRTRYRDNLRMNLTPLIDMVFLLLVFFMMTTTFNRESQLEINLPQANASASITPAEMIRVVIDAEGHYAINDNVLVDNRLTTLIQALEQAAANQSEPLVMISADQNATHQSVVQAMEAAKEAGLFKLTFEAQQIRE